MFDIKKNLSKEALKKNFEQAILFFYSKKKQPPSGPVLLAPVTTTFPKLKYWGTDASQIRYPYVDILFKDNAIYSDFQRQSDSDLSGYYKSDETRRTMDQVRQIGLDHYIFAYLGIHDPYYARCSFGDNPFFLAPAFGVFVNVEAEQFPFCNTSRRDFESPECRFSEIMNEFLLPNDARLLANYQVTYDDRHNGDFWHYWGSHAHWFKDNYYDIHWQWKFEFHFHEKLPVESFDAVLWPCELKAMASGIHIDSLSDGEADEFRKLYPECHVIPYRWRPDQPHKTFVKVSEAILRFFLDYGEYPETADEALKLMSIT